MLFFKNGVEMGYLDTDVGGVNMGNFEANVEYQFNLWYFHDEREVS